MHVPILLALPPRQTHPHHPPTRPARIPARNLPPPPRLHHRLAQLPTEQPHLVHGIPPRLAARQLREVLDRDIDRRSTQRRDAIPALCAGHDTHCAVPIGMAELLISACGRAHGGRDDVTRRAAPPVQHLHQLRQRRGRPPQLRRADHEARQREVGQGGDAVEAGGGVEARVEEEGRPGTRALLLSVCICACVLLCVGGCRCGREVGGDGVVEAVEVLEQRGDDVLVVLEFDDVGLGLLRRGGLVRGEIYLGSG